MPTTGKPAGTLPRNVVVLGIVSLPMGMSSAMVYGVLPVFLVTVLGTGVASIGAIEGIAEATTSFMKILSVTPAIGSADASHWFYLDIFFRQRASCCFRWPAL